MFFTNTASTDSLEGRREGGTANASWYCFGFSWQQGLLCLFAEVYPQFWFLGDMQGCQEPLQVEKPLVEQSQAACFLWHVCQEMLGVMCVIICVTLPRPAGCCYCCTEVAGGYVAEVVLFHSAMLLIYCMFFFQEPPPHGASKAPSGTGGSALNIDWFCFPDWCMLKLVLIVQGEPTAAPPAGQTPLEPTPLDVKNIIAQARRDRCLTWVF